MNIEKLINRGPYFIAAIILVDLAFTGAAVAVVWHFVSKWW